MFGKFIALLSEHKDEDTSYWNNRHVRSVTGIPESWGDTTDDTTIFTTSTQSSPTGTEALPGDSSSAKTKKLALGLGCAMATVFCLFFVCFFIKSCHWLYVNHNKTEEPSQPESVELDTMNDAEGDNVNNSDIFEARNEELSPHAAQGKCKVRFLDEVDSEGDVEGNEMTIEGDYNRIANTGNEEVSPGTAEGRRTVRSGNEARNEHDMEANRITAEGDGNEHDMEANRITAERDGNEHDMEANRITAEEDSNEHDMEANRITAEGDGNEHDMEANRITAERDGNEHDMEANRIIAEEDSSEGRMEDNSMAIQADAHPHFSKRRIGTLPGFILVMDENEADRIVPADVDEHDKNYKMKNNIAIQNDGHGYFDEQQAAVLPSFIPGTIVSETAGRCTVQVDHDNNKMIVSNKITLYADVHRQFNEDPKGSLPDPIPAADYEDIPGPLDDQSSVCDSPRSVKDGTHDGDVDSEQRSSGL